MFTKLNIENSLTAVHYFTHGSSANKLTARDPRRRGDILDILDTASDEVKIFTHH